MVTFLDDLSEAGLQNVLRYLSSFPSRPDWVSHVGINDAMTSLHPSSAFIDSAREAFTRLSTSDTKRTQRAIFCFRTSHAGLWNGSLLLGNDWSIVVLTVRCTFCFPPKFRRCCVFCPSAVPCASSTSQGSPPQANALFLYLAVPEAICTSFPSMARHGQHVEKYGSGLRKFVLSSRLNNLQGVCVRSVRP